MLVRGEAAGFRAPGAPGGEGGGVGGSPRPGAATAPKGREECGPEFPVRYPRPGACVWEVWGFAFEVELLPCLNYVRAKP